MRNSAITKVPSADCLCIRNGRCQCCIFWSVRKTLISWFDNAIRAALRKKTWKEGREEDAKLRRYGGNGNA